MARGSNPYSIGVAGRINFELDPSSQLRQFRREDEEAKAPHTLPYEMGELPQYYANIVENAFQAARTIDTLLKSENFENHKELFKLKTNTEKMLVYLMENVDEILSKFVIGSDKVDNDGV